MCKGRKDRVCDDAHTSAFTCREQVVEHLLEELRYTPEGHVFESYQSRWPPHGLKVGLVAYHLQGLRVWIPPGVWMFVLGVLYSKDKLQKPGQSGQRSKDKVQRENKKSSPSLPPRGAWICVLSVVQSRQRNKHGKSTKSEQNKEFRESLKFFSDLILPVALWPSGRLSL